MLNEHQQRLRDKYLAAPWVDAPQPWQALGGPGFCIPIGGLQGVGFGVRPGTGADLLMVVSVTGFGLIDPETGMTVARDREPVAPAPTGPDLACPGIGDLAGVRVPVAGLFGGGLHATTDDGWTVDVVAPEWPHRRVILSSDGGLNAGAHGTTWWHVFNDEHQGELRAAGFSPSGRTLVMATSSDVTLFRRR